MKRPHFTSKRSALQGIKFQSSGTGSRSALSWSRVSQTQNSIQDISSDSFSEDDNELPLSHPVSNRICESDDDDYSVPANQWAREDPPAVNHSAYQGERSWTDATRPMPDLLDLLHVESGIGSEEVQDRTRPVTAEAIVTELQSAADTDHHPVINDPKTQSTGYRPPGSHDKFFSALGLWADFCQISVKDYAMLAEVLKTATLEDLAALPRSLPTLQTYRRHLPLSVIRGAPVQLDPQQIPQRTSTQGFVYYFNAQEIVELILGIPGLRKSMHFGPALLVNSIKEIYEGTLWAEAIRTTSGFFPRYLDSSEAIFPSDVVQFNHLQTTAIGRVTHIWADCRSTSWSPQDHTWLLHVQLLSDYAHLDPGIQRAIGAVSPLPNELFLLESKEYMVEISPDVVLRRINLHIAGNPTPSQTPDAVTRYLICFNNHIRPVSCRFPLLAEREIEVFGRTFLQENYVRQENGRPILSIPSLLFVDGFGLYRNNYRSLLGIYLCPANLPFRERRRQLNQFVMTLGPFAASLKDVIEAMAGSLRVMDRGKEMVILGKNYLVHSTPIALVGDMPQQNKNCGALASKANKFCRFCFVDRGNGPVLDTDIVAKARYPSVVEDLRKQHRTVKSLSDWGLSISDSVWCDAFPAIVPVLQTPIDFMHSDIKGMSNRFQEVLFDMLSAEGSRKVGTLVSTMGLPNGWSRLQNPMTHRKSYSSTDLGHLTMILPYVLIQLDHQCFKKPQLAKFVRAFQCREADMVNTLTGVFARLAQFQTDGLREQVIRGSEETFHQCAVSIRREYHQLVQVLSTKDNKAKAAIKNLQQRPNQHIGLHLSAVMSKYGTLRNVDTTQGEEKHKPFKNAAPFTNSVNPDLQLLRRTNVLQAVRQIADGSYTDCADYAWISNIVASLQEHSPLLFNRLASPAAQVSLFNQAGDNFRSLKPDIFAIRATNCLANKDHPRTFEDLKKLLHTAYVEAGAELTTITGRLEFYARASFSCGIPAERVTVRTQASVLYNGNPALVYAILSHVRGAGLATLFLILHPWKQIAFNDVLSCPEYKEFSTSDEELLVPLTSVERPFPHLLRSTTENRYWWNKWDVHFH